MTHVAVTGVGVVASTGIGRQRFRAVLRPHRVTAGDDERPRVIEDFDVRTQLGRKGTAFLNRCAGMALLACREALGDSALPVDDPGLRVGVSLGTTTGSLQSMSDYTRDTLQEARPYLVNPGLFPNTVMNCSAGQVAIRYGLHGINTTIAAGATAFPGALRYANRALELGHLDATLVGAVEEYSEQRAWQARLARLNGHAVPPGEGSAVVVLERAADARAAGRHVYAELDSVLLGFVPGSEAFPGFEEAFERRIREALRRAGVAARDLALVAIEPPSDTARPELGRAALAAFGAPAAAIDLTASIGDCGAAGGALAFAALLGRHARQPALDGRPSLLAGWTTEGAVAAVVFRGWHDPREAAA
ncbi:MAG: beta-ketoacyl synthase N-terminal-like domain-containing protein [Solirubrobacteraceae bacterium]